MTCDFCKKPMAGCVCWFRKLRAPLALLLLLSACASEVGDAETKEVGVDQEGLFSSRCNNNSAGDVTITTPLGKGAAMCAASQEATHGFYACSGNFTAGTCTLALGSGLPTYKVTSCGAWVQQVPWPGTVVMVTTANRCFINYGTFTGYVYSGLRNSDNTPVYVYSVPSTQWHARADFVDPTQALYFWGI